MWRSITRGSTHVCGLAMAVWGLYAMLAGWDHVMIERGWSLYLAGAGALFGGAVVLALGQIMARLDALPAPPRAESSAQPEREKAAPPPSVKPPPIKTLVPKPEPAPQSEPAQKRPPAPPRAETPPPKTESAGQGEALHEVDRYVSGETTYVMYSDGAVEVRTAEGAQRYASLAELRAHAATAARAER